MCASLTCGGAGEGASTKVAVFCGAGPAASPPSSFIPVVVVAGVTWGEEVEGGRGGSPCAARWRSSASRFTISFCRSTMVRNDAWSSLGAVA